MYPIIIHITRLLKEGVYDEDELFDSSSSLTTTFQLPRSRNKIMHGRFWVFGQKVQGINYLPYPLMNNVL